MSTTTVRDAYRDATGQSGDNFKGDVRRVGEDLSKVKDDLNNAAHDVAAAAKSGYAAAKERTAHAIEGARERGEEMTESIQSRIKDNPLAAVAVAAGVGIVLGMLVCRR